MPGGLQNSQIDRKDHKREQKILFPLTAQGHAERNANDKTDDVSDVSHMGIIAAHQARVRDDDEVVNKINQRHQALRRQKDPGKF